MFEAIVRSNGWDGVTAALQLLSHLDGDALNVALLVPESQQGVAGIFGEIIVGPLQFSRAVGRIQASVSEGVSGDDPSIFAIELETLARRAFVDIDPLIQLQMVRDRFIDGQVECALHRHLDRPVTPMADIVDCCRVWESHIELASSRQMGTDRHSPRAVCQVTEDEQLGRQLGRRRLNHCRTSLENCGRRRRGRLRRRPPFRRTRISSFSD